MNIIFDTSGQGKGIGSLLIREAEEWAHVQGYRSLTLSVFSQNQQARKVYQRLGFEEDIIKYVKVLK